MSDQTSLKANDIGTCLFVPVLELDLANISSSLESVPNRVLAVHHQTHMMGALGVALAVALTIEEDRVACSSVGELDSPELIVSHVRGTFGRLLTCALACFLTYGTYCVSLAGFGEEVTSSHLTETDSRCNES